MYYNRWEKANTWDRCTMIQEEVKEDSRRSKAVGLGMQGSWTMWELLSRKVTWAELWRFDAFHFVFLLLSVCDTLSSAHFHTWGLAEEPSCKLCSSNGMLVHILRGCKTRLTQGRYRWRHDKVLLVLDDILAASA